MIDWAAVLKHMRREAHWSIREAAERSGVSAGTISKWECGVQAPTNIDLIEFLLEAYGYELRIEKKKITRFKEGRQ